LGLKRAIGAALGSLSGAFSPPYSARQGQGGAFAALAYGVGYALARYRPNGRVAPLISLIWFHIGIRFLCACLQIKL